jgi:hypothetical protein
LIVRRVDKGLQRASFRPGAGKRSRRVSMRNGYAFRCVPTETTARPDIGRHLHLLSPISENRAKSARVCAIRAHP